MTDDLEYRISKLHLRPGDILVVKFYDQKLTGHQVDTIRTQLEFLIGSGKCIVLDRGMDISILTAAEIQARASSEENEA